MKNKTKNNNQKKLKKRNKQLDSQYILKSIFTDISSSNYMENYSDFVHCWKITVWQMLSFKAYHSACYFLVGL